MKKTILFTCLALSLVACDNAPSSMPDSGMRPQADAGMMTQEDAGMMTSNLRGRDNPPSAGAQIDRAGRPAITAGTIGTFMPMAMADARNQLKNDYNADGEPGMWAERYADHIRSQIAIYDGLDEVCGNQLLADANPEARYSVLAGVLADDRLWLNAGSGTCGGVYLAVEANATGILANDDCGGRTPSADVIDRTYSVLVAGSLGGVGDTIDADDASHSSTDFPFLAAPL